MIISAEELRRLVARILVAAGASGSNAACVAEHLVSANLCGVDTHGVWQLAGYVSAIKSGQIVPDAVPEIIAQSPVSALVTGHWTFGQVAAKYAMETALNKASEHEVSVVSLVQSHHSGRLGEYAEMAVAKGMIGIVCDGGLSEEAPFAVPYGGRTRALSPNPIAMGFPAGQGGRMMFDFGTTAGKLDLILEAAQHGRPSTSAGTVANARRKGEPLPPGWIVDKHGNPSTNPSDFFDGGAYLPFGGHKGYALMMGTEFLGRIFSGSDSYAEAGRGGPHMGHHGVTMIVFRAGLFQAYQAYTRRADEFLHRIRAVPPAPGFVEVLAPGDRGLRTRAIREREGIPLPEDLWQELTGLAGSLGVASGFKGTS